MILAVHIAAINGNPYRIHAVGGDDSNIVCAIGPALVRPQDWLVPEGSPHTHRQCIRWGLPFRAIMGAVLRMAENASVIVAHDMAALDFRVRAWCGTDAALSKIMDGWTRPGPERVNLIGDEPVDAVATLAAYLDMKAKGIAA